MIKTALISSLEKCFPDQSIEEFAPLKSISVLKNDTPYPIAHPLIIDGVINRREASLLGYTEAEILKKAQISENDLNKIFLMTIDDNEKTEILIKEEK